MSTPREALEEFGKVILSEFESWYDEHSSNCYRWYLILQFTVFISSVGIAIIAALSDGRSYEAWVKYILVGLPLLAATATSLLTQLKLYDLWKLREQGRIESQALGLEARRRAADEETEEDCAKAHAEIESRLNQLEARQSEGFFGLYSSDLLFRVRPAKN